MPAVKRAPKVKTIPEEAALTLPKLQNLDIPLVVRTIFKKISKDLKACRNDSLAQLALSTNTRRYVLFNLSAAGIDKSLREYNCSDAAVRSEVLQALNAKLKSTLNLKDCDIKSRTNATTGVEELFLIVQVTREITPAKGWDHFLSES